MPHRHFHPPTSTYNSFINFHLFLTRFSIYILQSKMTNYTEDEVNQALEAIANGQSIRIAARNWGIPRSTLRSRITGTQPRAIAFASQQKLSPTQESHLVEWIQVQAALGLPPTHQQIREFAERILRLRGGPQTLGKNWFQAFLCRNPSIKVQRARAIDSQRINGASTDIIRV